MKREIKLLKNDLVINACIAHEQTKEKDFNITTVSAVDLTNSKCLQLINGDFGLAVHNEDYFGFYLSWKDYEELQEKLKIKEEEYEDFLMNITEDLVDSVISHVNELRS